MLMDLSLNIPLLEALEQIPGYGKFMKEFVIKKRVLSFDDVGVLHYYSFITSRSLEQKNNDPGVFMIPCTIRTYRFARALCDLGVSINLISLTIFK